MHLMELLGDIGHVECHFSTFGHSVSVKARPLFMPNMPYTEKSFRTQSIILLDDEAQVEAHFGPFGDRANLDTR
jgi:hypothetical protein